MEQQVPQAPVSTPSRSMMPPVGSLFSQMWEDYKVRVGTYTGIQALSILLVVICLVIVLLGAFGGAYIFDSSSAPRGALLGGGIVAIIFAVILVIALSMWLQATLLYAVTHSREQSGIKSSLGMGWKMVRSYFWLILLTGIISMGGFFLFFIPGIMFGVWFLLAPYVLATEGERGMSAILKSRLYVKEYFWPVVGRFLLFYVIVMFAVYIPTMIFEALKLQILTGLYSILIQLAITPLFSIYIFKMYEQLKAIKGPIQIGPETNKDKLVIVWIAILGYILPVVVTALAILATRP